MATSVAPACSICGQNQVHRFHLSDTKRAPSSADETEHELSLGEQVGRRNKLAVVVGEIEGRRFGSDRQNVRCKMPSLEFRDGLRVNGLRLRRNILRDQLLALGKDFAQRTRVEAWTGFF